MNPSNFLDWLCVFYFAVLATAFTFHIQDLTELREYLQRASVTVQGSWEDPMERVNYFAFVDRVGALVTMQRQLVAGFPYVIVSRFFKAFASQPRLAMVTETLRKAAS